MIGNNAKCPCGSGKKYKKCCLSAGCINRTHSSRVARNEKMFENGVRVAFAPAMFVIATIAASFGRR